MAPLLADENLPAPVVEALRRLGHDVLTLADRGHAGQALTDAAVLQLATADGRAVVTLNRRHFIPGSITRIPRMPASSSAPSISISTAWRTALMPPSAAGPA